MRLARGVLCALVLLGCSRADEEQASARRSPASPPPPAAELPADIAIPVTVDGAEAPPVTTAMLGRLPPDFADEERRAWRLERLVPGFKGGASIDAVSREGVAITMKVPGAPDALQPVLFITRRGDRVATLVDPAEPFPEFHGQGGRLRRPPGDTTPRVWPVVRFDVRTAATPEP
jgi:hypothetical protein